MKKILSGKNFVTVLGFTVLIGILFLFYSKRVNDTINPIEVPYAKQTIPSGTLITNKMVGTTSVPPSMLSDDVLRNMADVVKKYSSADTVIPEGSLFYRRNVVSKQAIPSNIIFDLKDGYTLYNLRVDTESTYGNKIFPGNYVDLYLSAMSRVKGADNIEQEKVIVGKIVQNVQVIAVKDGDGLPVFEELEEERKPSIIVFAVPNEYYILLKKAEYLRTYDSELFPVPTKEGIGSPAGALELTSEKLKSWIEDLTMYPEQF